MGIRAFPLAALAPGELWVRCQFSEQSVVWGGEGLRKSRVYLRKVMLFSEFKPTPDTHTCRETKIDGCVIRGVQLGCKLESESRGWWGGMEMFIPRSETQGGVRERLHNLGSANICSRKKRLVLGLYGVELGPVGPSSNCQTSAARAGNSELLRVV